MTPVCGIGLIYALIAGISATPFYYGTYRSYGTGDTVISTSHANGGPKTPGSKWQVECLDGEAVIGVLDNVFDFGGITNVWCKFMFPYKVATRNVYPYYQYCHVRDFTKESFCYDPRNHTTTANTFITGFFDNEASFWVYRPDADAANPYKCCKTPPGYYLDYVSCYYQWTHDQYWEYYDSNFFLLNCATGYIMTGITKKRNPVTPNEFRIEWVQCCRVGYGAVIALPPPVIHTPNGGAQSYAASGPYTPTEIPSDYAGQYSGKRSAAVPTAIRTKRDTVFVEGPLEGDDDRARSAFLEEISGNPDASRPNDSWKPVVREQKTNVKDEVKFSRAESM